MKYQHIIQAVYFQPWSITREGWSSVHNIVKAHLAGGHKLPENMSGDVDFLGQPLPKMEITPTGVAIIPVNGPLIHHASLIEKMCGACSYDDIKRDVKAAMDSGCNKIVLHVDSPGGMAMGSHECAKLIETAAEFVRVEAVTDGMMCSAAYDICAGANAIYCTPSSMVGSIGSMMGWLDESVRYEMAGLKVEMFTSGDLKGIGTPGTSLTPEHRAHLQGMVDKFAGMFRAHVLEHRVLSESTMQGQGIIGEDAEELGLVDHLIDDVEERFYPAE